MLDVVVCDCEVFKHYFCMVGYECISKKYVLCEDTVSMRQFFIKHRDAIWVFYNAQYDRYIVKAALMGANNQELRELSDFIIEQKRQGYEHPKYGGFDNAYRMFVYDAMTTKNGLKTLEAFLGEDIQETTVPFDLDRPLTPQERENVIKYCTNDVAQTFKVLQLERDKFLAHWKLVNKFKLPYSHMSKSMGRLASTIVQASKKRQWVGEWDIVYPKHLLQLGKYEYVAKWFEEQARTAKQGRECERSLTVDVFGIPTVFAWGGAHGALNKYSSTGRIAAWDVTSLYPSIMVKYGILSRQITSPDLLKSIYTDRIKFKAEGNSLNLPYKLAINSLYGLHGDKFSDVYDPSMAKSICVTGQLLILDLAEKLGTISEKVGAKLVQLNTDAVYVEYHTQEQLLQLQAAASEWEARTSMELEREDYLNLKQRDVNNYIMTTPEGYIKGRGGDLKKPTPLDYNMPIVRNAMRAYLAHGVPVETTINQCNDMMQFQIVFKRQGKYDKALHNGKYYDETVFRVFASTDPKDTKLFKVCTQNGRTDSFANCPSNCFIYNDSLLDNPVLNNLDREWYIKEALRRVKMFE